MHFEQAVSSILERDRRFAPGAYEFLKDALDFTLKQVMDQNGGVPRHVDGPELLRGFRDHALQQFGPMASTLLQEWGVRCCSDVGDMVFLLIEENVFGRQESDSKRDFEAVYDFEDAFVVPFQPAATRREAEGCPI
jgi:uncharacterized repeat protein (TIGR04138 family)